MSGSSQVVKIHSQDTSRRQVLYLKLKIMKLGEPEAFRTLKSVPCQRLIGGGVGVTDDDDIMCALYQNDKTFMKLKLFKKF